MASEKQIEANRRNAQKSTGPRTEEGPGDDPEACVLRHQDNIRATANLARYLAQSERSFRTAFQQLLRIRQQAGNQPAPAEVEEIKAPVTQIGFASQKEEERHPTPIIQDPTSAPKPAARKIGFAPQKSPKPSAQQPIPDTQYRLYQHPKSNIQHPLLS